MRIKIGLKEIGDNCPAYIIAEGCDNHLGRMDHAKEMVLRAKEAGADAIKFQHHLPDEEMLPSIPMSSNFEEPLYDFLKKYALSLQQHRELKAFCEKTGIQYLCTPFSLKAAQEIATLDVPAFKIGSGEMTDIPSLEAIAKFGKPMIISTGMSDFEEIDRTYQAIMAQGVPLVLMNCVSEYPPVYEDINLGVIPQMIARYPRAVIGHSDHTPDLFTTFAAIPLGAKLIEKHLILDKKQPGPDQSVSIDFTDLKNLVEGVRKIEKALGAHKKVHDQERQIRSWAFRSLVSVGEIRQGELIGKDQVWSKRPGTGIPSFRMAEVIGKKAKKTIPANSLIAWEDLE
jgi:N-acetylneuraminate synthase